MGKLNMDLIRQAKQRLERQGSNASFDKLVNGKNVRRILFPKGDKEMPYSEGYIHFGLGDDGKTSMICRKTAGANNNCPICNYIKELQQSKNPVDRKLADAIKARKRVYFNVLDRDNIDEESNEIKIMVVGLKLQRDIINILCDPDYGDITDFDEGREVTIKRTGQGLNTEYNILPRPKATPASTKLTKEELEDAMPDLDAMWNIPSEEDMENLLYGEDSIGDNPKSLEGSSNNADDSDEYDDMELSELKELCIKRNISLPEKVTKLKLIALLTQYDTNSSSDDFEGYDEDSGDEVKSAIAGALNKRK